MGRFKLTMEKDSSGPTFGYQIIDTELNEVLLTGDGYESEELLITELSSLSEAFRGIFG